jgi:hypothetical protein
MEFCVDFLRFPSKIPIQLCRFSQPFQFSNLCATWRFINRWTECVLKHLPGVTCLVSDWLIVVTPDGSCAANGINVCESENLVLFDRFVVDCIAGVWNLRWSNIWKEGEREQTYWNSYCTTEAKKNFSLELCYNGPSTIVIYTHYPSRIWF